MKILGFKAENVMGLVFVDLTPDKTFQKIAGANGQGKSSFINAIRWGLGGGDYAPDKLIRKGADDANVEINLGEYIVKRHKSLEGAPSLKIESRDENGKRKNHDKPQKMLNDILGGGVTAFDPLAFARSKPDDQADLLRRVTGLDTKAHDDEAKKVYDERTAVNREVKRLEAQLADMMAPEPPADPGPDVDLAKIIGENESAMMTNRRNEKYRQEARALEKQHVDLVDRRRKLEEELNKVNIDLEAIDARLVAARPVIAALVDVDMAAITEKMRSAQQTNANNAKIRQSIADANRRHNEIDQKRQELKEAQRQAAHHTSRLDEIEREKAELLAAVQMPVTGLSITGNTVSYNGVPVSQCSRSEQVRIGMAIASSLHPKLDTILVEGGECLDAEQINELQKWAEARDVQVIIEIVGDAVVPFVPAEKADPKLAGPSTVVMEKGRVKKKNVSGS